MIPSTIPLRYILGVLRIWRMPGHHNDTACSLSGSESNSPFPLPVTGPPPGSKLQKVLQVGPTYNRLGEYHYPERRNKFRTVKQPAQGHTAGRWNGSMCPQQEDGEETLAFLLQDAFGNQEEKQIRGMGWSRQGKSVQCSSIWFGSSPKRLPS